MAGDHYEEELTLLLKQINCLTITDSPENESKSRFFYSSKICDPEDQKTNSLLWSKFFRVILTKAKRPCCREI